MLHFEDYVQSKTTGDGDDPTLTSVPATFFLSRSDGSVLLLASNSALLSTSLSVAVFAPASLPKKIVAQPVFSLPLIGLLGGSESVIC